MAEWDGAEEQIHPSQHTVFVRSTAPAGSDPWSWNANGKTVTIAPGETKTLPRWVFDLGCKYANHPLEILNPDEGSIEVEETKAKQKAARLKEIEEQYAKEKAEYEQAEANAKAKRAEAKKGAGKDDKKKE